MKIRKILFSLFSILTCVSAAEASPSGSYTPQFYIGVQGGYANTNFSKGDVIAVPSSGSVPINTASIGNHVFAARGYAGYRFNDYLALEAGYLKPKNTRYTNINNGTVPNGYVSEYAIDLTGKLFLPMAAYIHLSPYFKIGGAYVNAASHGGITRNGANDFGYSFHPLIGGGIGYDVTPSMTVDISYTTMTQRNTSTPRIDMIFLGFTYHFGLEDAKNGPNYGDVDGIDP